jgi:hypothetical protein
VLQRWKAVPFATILVMEHATDHPGVPGGLRRVFDDTALTLLRARVPATPQDGAPATPQDGAPGT